MTGSNVLLSYVKVIYIAIPFSLKRLIGAESRPTPPDLQARATVSLLLFLHERVFPTGPSLVMARIRNMVLLDLQLARSNRPLACWL